MRAAALDVKQQLLEMAAEQLKADVASLELKDGVIADRNAPEKKVALKDLARLQEQQTIVGVGRRRPHPKGKVGLPFVAHFAEVEVDTRTGEVRVLRLLGAHDSGRVMNRLTYENQVFGGMTMGIGFAMTEGRVLDRNTGKMANANWHDYKIADREGRAAGLRLRARRPARHGVQQRRARRASASRPRSRRRRRSRTPSSTPPASASRRRRSTPRRWRGCWPRRKAGR